MPLELSSQDVPGFQPISFFMLRSEWRTDPLAET